MRMTRANGTAETGFSVRHPALIRLLFHQEGVGRHANELVFDHDILQKSVVNRRKKKREEFPRRIDVALFPFSRFRFDCNTSLNHFESIIDFDSAKTLE